MKTNIQAKRGESSVAIIGLTRSGGKTGVMDDIIQTTHYQLGPQCVCESVCLLAYM